MTESRSSGECIRYPACGCADPFAGRWHACVTAPETPAAGKAPIEEEAAGCQFHPECGCAHAHNCPMKCGRR